jgi:cytochrome P450 PksS
MLDMFRRLVRERRAAPDDKLISAIIQARHEGDRLDDDEVLGMVFLLLLAGHDTTANLLAMSALMLTEHPEQLERLRNDPGLIQPAVEELLRFTAPVTTPGPRIAKEHLEIRGVPISKGTPILGMLISANRDEEVFSDPDILDFGRTPNRHLGFGFGGHMCLGLMLARLEARIAISTLVQRFSRIELAVPREAIQYKAANLRGLKSLPLRLSEA